MSVYQHRDSYSTQCNIHIYNGDGFTTVDLCLHKAYNVFRECPIKGNIFPKDASVRVYWSIKLDAGEEREMQIHVTLGTDVKVANWLTD
jgi:hypothetical protein